MERLGTADRAFYFIVRNSFPTCPESQAAEGNLPLRSVVGVDYQSQQARAVRIGLNYLIDVEHAIIVDIEATPGGAS